MSIRRFFNFAIVAALFVGVGMLSDATSANTDRAQTAINHISGAFHG